MVNSVFLHLISRINTPEYDEWHLTIPFSFTEYRQWPTEVQRLQRLDVQSEVLADGVQKSFEGQDWHSESRTAQGRAARSGLPSQHRSAVRADFAVHAQRRHPEIRRFRVRHTAPEHRVQFVRVQGSAAQRQHQTEPGRMAQVGVRVLIRAVTIIAQFGRF